MSVIRLATAEGLRRVGRAEDDPLGGFDTTTLVAGDDVLSALTRNRRIWRVAGGAAEQLARVDGAIAWCLLWHAGALWVGTDEAGLLRLEGERLARVAGFDRAPGRERWQQPVKRPATTWTLASDGEEDVHEVSAGGRIWAATGEHALAESLDHGASWAHHGAGLHAPYLSCAVPTDAGVLVVASSGYACEDDAVYRFDGRAFERCQGLPDQFGGCLGARQLAAKGRVAAVADSAGRLYLSEDGGGSWTVAAEGLPAVRAIVIE